MTALTRARYAALFGPTTGDQRPTVLISLTEDPSAGPVLAWVREQLKVTQTPSA